MILLAPLKSINFKQILLLALKIFFFFLKTFFYFLHHFFPLIFVPPLGKFWFPYSFGFLPQRTMHTNIQEKKSETKFSFTCSSSYILQILYAYLVVRFRELMGKRKKKGLLMLSLYLETIILTLLINSSFKI